MLINDKSTAHSTILDALEVGTVFKTDPAEPCVYMKIEAVTILRYGEEKISEVICLNTAEHMYYIDGRDTVYPVDAFLTVKHRTSLIINTRY